MANIIDYVEQEFRTVREKPLSAVDTLVLSELSYINLGAVLSELSSDAETIELRDLLRAEAFDSLFHDVRDTQSNRRLLFALAASPRFRHMRIGNLKEKQSDQLEEQFAAVTVYPDEAHVCVVFRGTDATLIGWKEDFNMAFLPVVPAQSDAVDYVNRIGTLFPGRLSVCGHSKGGNLAVYAAMQCDFAVQARITAVYSHDGPGFASDIQEKAEYRSVADRIHKLLPQSSLIGMLLENHGTYTVVESSQIGIMQHDPHSWEVQGAGFVTVEELTADSRFLNRTLKNWLAGMTVEERNAFFDSVFELLAAGDASRTNEIMRPQNLLAYFKTLRADENLRRVIGTELAGLLQAAKNAQHPEEP